MTRSDDILDLIDGGLQSSYEDGYGTDRRPDLCARCQHNALAKDGDLCAECRSFLLGDSDVDRSRVPVGPLWRLTEGGDITVTAWFRWDTSALDDLTDQWHFVVMHAIAPAVEAVAEGIRGLTGDLAIFDEALTEPPALVARLRHGNAATCPRHGPTRGGTCLACARPRTRSHR